MTISTRSWSWKLSTVSCLVIGGAIASCGESVLAQIMPDTTLGNENSTVTSAGEVDSISGGATRGANLFHSFGEFNINEGQAAVFTNPAGIENILTRVTGANPSNILGTLGVAGNANLFLMNPNGIIFGANARLDIGGSFVGTTANAIRLNNSEIFSANPQAPLPSGLLSVNPNALLFNQIKAAAIVNRSIANLRGLQVHQGRSLLLLGGDVSLEGGQISAPGGRVELGSVAGSGTIGLNIDNSDLRLNFPEHIARANVSLNNRADVNVRAGGGGNIAVNAQNLNLAGESSLRAGIGSGLGSIDSQAGNIEINTVEVISLTDESTIANTVPNRAIGQGGDIEITGRALSLSNGSALNANITGQGQGGNLRVIAPDSVQVNGASADGERFSRLTAQTGGIGDAGSITINTGKLLIKNGGQVSTATLPSSIGKAGILLVNASDEVRVSGASQIKFFNDGRNISRLTTRTAGSGRAGNLTINTGKLVIENGAQVSSGTVGDTSIGDGGNLTVNASDSVKVTGFVIIPGDDPVLSRLTTRSGGTGNAGNLTINTTNFAIENGAQVSSGTIGVTSTGDGGNLTVNASDSVKVTGFAVTQDPNNPEFSRMTTRTEGAGRAGELIINTGKLALKNGAQVTSSAFTGSTGNAGNLTVNALDSVEVSGLVQEPDNSVSSRLTTRTEGTGNAGNLTINARKLVVRNGAQVSAGTVAFIPNTGAGGNLTVNASDSVEVSGSVPVKSNDTVSSRLGTRTQTDGNAGNLKITTGKLIIQDGADVSVNADVGINNLQGLGTAGNLEIFARSILLDNNATLNARATSVDGGNIWLQGLDLLLMRRNSRISASAGIAGAGGNGGNISIDTDLLVAVPSENSNITANAFRGNGGNINIISQGIFGIQFRENETPQSDITASSRFGLNGVVEFNTPDIDPSRGLTLLPVIPVDIQVSQACTPGSNQANSEFVVTGRGGLPPTPTEALNPDAIAVDWVTLQPESKNNYNAASSTSSTTPESKPIVEAQGWIINHKGEVVLTASAPTATPHSSWQTLTNCPS